MRRSPVHLLLHLHLLRHHLIPLLGVLVSVQTDLVPRQLKQPIHALERPPGCLGHTEKHPHSTEDGHRRKAPERALGGDAAVLGGQQHVGHRARVAVLVGKVQRHGDGGRQGPDAQREELRREQVLHRVPAERPAEPGDIDHGDGAAADAKLGLRQDKVVDDAHLRDVGQEGGDVDHGDGLQGDTDEEGALAADHVDQEQGAGDGCDELDDPEHTGHEQALVGPGDTEQLEEIGGVEGDGAGAGPLRENLRHERQVDAVQVLRDEKGLLDDAEPASAHGRLEFGLVGLLDGRDLLHNVLVVLREVSHARQIADGVLVFALFDQEARGLVLQKGEKEDQAGEDDVQTGWHFLQDCSAATDIPAVVASLTHRLCVLSPRLTWQP